MPALTRTAFSGQAFAPQGTFRVRAGLFGANTDEVVGHLREVMDRVRAEEL